MIPVVALVGRPNVGKSTLFNRLTRTQAALVADYPGLTRDRQYGDVSYEGHSFIVIDTGGIGVDDSNIDALMSEQSGLAIQEADLIFFMVDARDGLTPVDVDIATQLRKQGKEVALIVNKIDGLNADVVTGEFDGLGFPIHSIAASHGRGIKALVQATIPTPATAPEGDEPTPEDGICIALVGRPNVGKSTLTNRLLGESRVVVCDLPGTTRDSIYIPFERESQRYTLIDTAGVRRRARVSEKVETFSIIKTLQSIKGAHVCLLLIDAKEGLTSQDLNLISFIIEAGKALVVVVNKWDGLEESHKKHIHATLDRRLGFLHFCQVRFISALHGTGVGLLFKDINTAYEAAMKHCSTPQLTRLIQEIVQKHPPPLSQGKSVKIRYAHMGGHNPPIIVLHGNRLRSLPDSYKRYLTNALTDKLRLKGTPIKLSFKHGDNPYEGLANKKKQPSKRR